MTPLEASNLFWLLMVALSVAALLPRWHAGIWLAPLMLAAGKAVMASTALFGVKFQGMTILQNSSGFDRLDPQFSWGTVVLGIQAIAFAGMVPAIRLRIGVALGILAAVVTFLWVGGSARVQLQQLGESNPGRDTMQALNICWHAAKYAVVDLIPLWGWILAKRQIPRVLSRPKFAVA